MPTNLTGSKIKDTYTQVLHVDGGPTGTEKVVYSGTGVATALSLSTGSASVDNIRIDGNTISSTNTNGNINITPNGTGAVVIPTAQFTTLNATTFNTTNVTAGMAVTNASITAAGTDTNINITLTPKGTGSVVIPKVAISGGAASGMTSVAATTVSATTASATTVEGGTVSTTGVAAHLDLSTTSIVADGTNTNIDITLTPKGTGSVNLPSVIISSGAASGMTSVAATTLTGGTVSTTGAAAHLDLSTNSVVADGTDTDIDITLTPKGTGVVSVPRAVVSVNSTSDALRITQTGTGNALVVEDSANPDASSFIIDAAGTVTAQNNLVVFGSTLYGSATAYSSFGATPRFQYNGSAVDSTTIAINSWRNSATTGGTLTLNHARGVTAGVFTALGVNDVAGAVNFAGSDGTAFIDLARITAAVDGTPGTNDMPGRLVFATTPDGTNSPTERMRIDSAGNVGIGTTAPGALLNVVANTATDAVRITQTGAGNALLVEDSANPDATPFVVNSIGSVGIGLLAPETALHLNGQFTLDRNETTSTTQSQQIIQRRKRQSDAILVNGDRISAIFSSGWDGTAYILATAIYGEVDGTPGTNDMPGRLVFSTTADGASTPTERMRISSAGLVTVAGTLQSATVSTTGVAAHLDLTGTTLSADGTDTNIDITLTPKGTGSVVIPKVAVTAGTVPYNTITNWAYASFYDAGTTDQTGSTTDRTAVEWATAAVAGAGVTVASNSRITLATAGTYRFNASLQFSNSSNTVRTVDLWFAKNGTDIVGSGARITVPANNAGGTNLVAFEIFETVAANDYVEMFWHPSNVSATLHYIAPVASNPGVTPAIPAVPPAIVVVQRIA
jgi:hypothetical protein